MGFPMMRDWECAAVAENARADLVFRDVDVEAVAARMRGRLVYLATPYSKQCLDGSGEWSYARSVECGLAAAAWCGTFAHYGVTAMSPISQAVDMVGASPDHQGLDPLDGKFWEAWCRPLLLACDAVVIPPLDGWRESEGIWHEARVAVSRAVPVFLLRGA